MASKHSTEEQLAITISKLEQVTKQLIEKDLENVALHNEVARLRQACSTTGVTEAYSSTSHAFDCGKVVSKQLNQESPSLRIQVYDTDIICHKDELTVEASPSTTPLSMISTKPPTMVGEEISTEEELTLEAFDLTDAQQTSQDDLNEDDSPEETTLPCDDESADSHGDPAPEDPQDHYSQPTNCSWIVASETNINGWDTGEPWTPAPTGDQPGAPRKENWRESLLRPESKSWLHRLSFAKPAHTLSDAEYKDILDLHRLPLATRLEDEDWLNSPLEHVRADDERLFRLLTRGREVAQKCLWAYLDRNQPDVRRREYPGGWQHVQLEVTALDYSVGYRVLQFRQNDLELVWRTLHAVVRLRHTTCHWNQRNLGWARPSPRAVDAHLKNVQKLAIQLYDEKRAAEARSLRDEARRAVEETVEEIEALEPLFDVYPWKYHHEQMFTQIQHAKDEKTPDLYQYPAVVLRAAEAWSRHHSSDQASEDDWEREDRITEDPEPKTRDQQNDVEDEKENAASTTKHAFTNRTLSRRHSLSSAKMPDSTSIASGQKGMVRVNSSIFNC